MNVTASTRTVLSVDPDRIRKINAGHALKFKNNRSLTELKAMSIRIDPSSFSQEVRAYFLSIKPDTVVYIPMDSSGCAVPVAYLSQQAASLHQFSRDCTLSVIRTTMLDFVNTIPGTGKFSIIKAVRDENLRAWKKAYLG